MMKSYVSRLTVSFEGMELTGETEMAVTFKIGDKLKKLSTCNPVVIDKFKGWNFAEGVTLRLYYTTATNWDAETIDLNMVIDKHFRKED